MATVNISIPDELKTFIEKRASSGSYSSTSDYIRAVLRQQQELLAEKEEIERLLKEAIDDPRPPIVITPKYWDEMRTELHARIGKAKKKKK